MLAGLTAGSARAETGTLTTVRYAGEDRFETAVSISRGGWDSAACVVLASGMAFPDALSGVPLSAALDAPILLAGKNFDVTLQEIQRLGASKVVILGGTSAVSAENEEAVRAAGIDTERIAGATRFETAVMIAERLDGIKAGESSDAIIGGPKKTDGIDPQATDGDASGSQGAEGGANDQTGAAGDGSLRITEPEGIDGQTVDLSSGNTGSTSGQTGTDGQNASGQTGTDGNETAQTGGSIDGQTAGTDQNADPSDLQQVRAYDGNRAAASGAGVFFAYAYNFPDALSASVAAALTGAPILFMNSDGSIGKAAEDYLVSRGVGSAVILGGTASIGEGAEAKLDSLSIEHKRIFGQDRYLTNLAVLEEYSDFFTEKGVCAASALNFPDALSVGAFAAKNRLPLLLIGESITAEQYDWLESFMPERAVIAGGEKAVSELTEYRLADYTGRVTDHVVDFDDPNYTYLGQTIAKLNMRVAPGSGNRIIVAIPRYSMVDVLGRQMVDGDYWYRVTFEESTGWVNGRYLLVLEITEEKQTEATAEALGIINGSSVILRQAPSTASAAVSTLSKNTEVVLLAEKDGQEAISGYGTKWYKVRVGSKTGYVYGKFITPKNGEPADPTFEEYLDSQGFPESYRSGLRALHEKYPEWVFTADHITDRWAVAVQKQYVFGDMLPAEWGGTKAVSLISKSSDATWKSKDPGAYDPATGKWVTNWDGSSWAIASKEIVRYFLDPRNFLNETDVFQFMDLGWQENATAEVVSEAAAGIGATWLSYDYPIRSESSLSDTDEDRRSNHVTEEGEFYHVSDDTYIDYPKTIEEVCREAGMNPVALVCIMTQELGITSSALNRPQISGSISGYEGFYNYFNIGAYVDGTYSKAYLRGLHIARDVKNWNTRRAALSGGAVYFADNYVKKNQSTFYYKRFNVINGINSNQFSTDTQGPYGEGRMLAKAYSEELRGCALTFRIPVYDEMPAAACPRP